MASKMFFLVIGFRRLTLRMGYFLSGGNTRVALASGPQSAEQFLSYYNQGFKKLNIGGGSKNIKEFVNIDFVKNRKAEREIIANALDLSFIPDNSVEHVHSNHFIEHISQEELCLHLKDCRRVLAPGGILTVRCPNALGVCYGFILNPVFEADRDDFVKLGFPPDEEFANPGDGWFHRDIYGLYHWLYGFTGNIKNCHLNRITPSGMKKDVLDAGFEILKMSDPEACNIVLVARKKPAVTRRGVCMEPSDDFHAC